MSLKNIKDLGLAKKRHMHNQREEFISVVIPAFNESERIVPTIERINEYLVSHFQGFEIIVVDDGSKDHTGELVLNAKQKIKSLTCVRYEENRGKGHAIRRGVSSSKGDIILISDADLSTPIEEMEKLLVQFDKGYDIVIGSRALKDSDIAIRQPWWRECMGKTFNRFVRFLILDGFMDTQCGFKLFKGDSGRKIFQKATIDRFAYDVEVLYIAKEEGFKIKEVPIRWLNSPASKVRPVEDSLQAMKDLIRIKVRKPR